jgi:hypothetical protein
MRSFLAFIPLVVACGPTVDDGSTSPDVGTLAHVATPANIGTCVHLPPADTLDLTVDLGGAWIRIDLNWDIAQPAPDQWNWAPFDAVIDAATARGLRVYATLGYTPAWASTGNRNGDGAHNDVPAAANYRAFVEAAVDRYKDRVGIFGTWNEPNLGDFFEGTKQEWIDNVYRPGVLGIRAQCATACRRPGSPRSVISPTTTSAPRSRPRFPIWCRRTSTRRSPRTTAARASPRTASTTSSRPSASSAAS